MIVNIGKISKVFENAHGALLDRRGFPMGSDHPRVLMHWWEEEYGVRIIVDPTWARFEKLEFVSEVDYTQFLLRWA